MELEHSSGSHGHYLSGSNHSERLLAALTAFHRALTRRWREEVCEAVVGDHATLRTAIRRTDARATIPVVELWPDYETAPVRFHIGSYDCAYINWVHSGRDGDLHTIRCEGLTYAGSLVQDGNPLPERISCGMGAILARVADWAWGERDHIFAKLPLFDRHDLGTLDRAYHTYVTLGGKLGLERKASDSEVATPIMDSPLRTPIELVAAENGEGQDWWAGWTGLAASRAKSGFFASVIPSLNNQARLAGHLANLYSDRAAIIEKGRNDALFWIQWATRSLDQTEMIDDPVTTWKVIQGIGTAVSISGGWSGVGATAGAAIVLVGFLGENIDAAVQTQQYGQEMAAIVGRLDDQVTALNNELDVCEQDFERGVSRLQESLYSLHSFNLELYDLTENRPEGDREECRDFTAEVDSILRIAENCYGAADLYEDLLPLVARTSDADPYLADKDGVQTTADRNLLGLRDQLEQYLKTSCGRYLVAADQVREAAESYAETERRHQATFDGVMADWAEEGVGEVDVDFDPARAAGATDRSGYNPHEDPVRAGREPGLKDGLDYVTETDATEIEEGAEA